jgi:hypothetical protein
MNWWSLLLYPLRVGPLLLLLAAAALLALAGAVAFPGAFGVLYLVPWLLLVWTVARYATVLLRSSANGVEDPPALTIEMANPWQRLPHDAALPLLWRAPAGLGGYWPLVMACALLAAAALAGLLLPVLRDRLPWPLFLHYCVAIYALWVSAAIAGGAIHWRRAALGFQPLVAPERVAARLEAERQARRSAMLDELYRHVRMQYQRSGAEVLEAWLGGCDADHAEADARQTFEQLCQWQDVSARQRLTAQLVAFLLRQRLSLVALELIVRAERQPGGFQPQALAEAQTLAELARATGQRQLAARLERRPT